MIKNLLIGAGQIGSRHLQGMLRSTQVQEIFVLDPNEQSLAVSKQRADEIIHRNIVHYITDWEKVPGDISIAIVATGAMNRERIIEQLLTKYNVQFLILEKILFQTLEAYDNIEGLLKSTSVKTWVNHPQLLFPHYIGQKEQLEMESPGSIGFQVFGSNWGLACNTLHYLELFQYLSGSRISTINTSMLDEEVLPSKRQGYIEFTGTLFGSLQNGNFFSITSVNAEPGSITVHIQTPDSRIIVQEDGASNRVVMNKKTGYMPIVETIHPVYQSTLTGILVDELIAKGNIGLPTFEQASFTHRKFISELLNKYSQITGKTETVCPIT